MLTAILPLDIGPGQVGSRVTHQLHNVGRVGSGQKKVTNVQLCMGQDGQTDGQDTYCGLLRRPHNKICTVVRALIVTDLGNAWTVIRFCTIYPVSVVTCIRVSDRVANDIGITRSYLATEFLCTNHPKHYL